MYRSFLSVSPSCQETVHSQRAHSDFSLPSLSCTKKLDCIVFLQRIFFKLFYSPPQINFSSAFRIYRVFYIFLFLYSSLVIATHVRWPQLNSHVSCSSPNPYRNCVRLLRTPSSSHHPSPRTWPGVRTSTERQPSVHSAALLMWVCHCLLTSP